MSSISQSKRYLSHAMNTKINSVKLYRQTGNIGFVVRRYHISKASLVRGNKQYDGTRKSLLLKSHRPHSQHPNAHTEDIKWIRNYHRCKPNIGVRELYGKLRQDQANRHHPGSLYRVFVGSGYRKKVESKKKSKHVGYYDMLTEPGIKWPLDVKRVPLACCVGKESYAHGLGK